MFEKLLKWDSDTLIYLNNFGSSNYDTFWLTVTSIATWVPLYLFFLFLFFYKPPLKKGLLKAISFFSLVGFIIILTNITKNYVERLRPNNDTEINTLIRTLKSPTDYSFFSGHAASSISIALLVFLMLHKQYRWVGIFFIWPILFGYSRIYVGVHFPLDIIVGAIVGLFFGYLFYRLYQFLVKRFAPNLKHSA